MRCFNPRTRAGCDSQPLLFRDEFSLFQSTHPRGVRLDDVGIYIDSQIVSIHAPARGATSFTFFAGIRVVVSIHAPARGATKARKQDHLRRKFQSTHPRGVRHIKLPATFINCYVSIHAPARGATVNDATGMTFDEVFQSTHPRGVRHNNALSLTYRELGFNPRTRAGCDAVSWPGLYPTGSLFQSTHPRGVRQKHSQKFPRAAQFQSTHPRGVRLYATIPGGVENRGFNPRTRAGCDQFLQGYAMTVTLFQSTHPRGVRLVEAASAGAATVFQSTHPRGVRLIYKRRGLKIIGVSIHAPARGATGVVSSAIRIAHVSIHAPARGATSQNRRQFRRRLCFNPRTRAGCDLDQ